MLAFGARYDGAVEMISLTSPSICKQRSYDSPPVELISSKNRRMQEATAFMRMILETTVGSSIGRTMRRPAERSSS